jgi:hypothetical protein
MPALSASIAPSDRKVVAVFAGLFIVILLAGMTLGTGAPAEGFGLPSTYSFGPGGARAAFTLLKETGYEVERWEKSPVEIPSPGEGVVLILAEPVFPPGEDERQALSRFVRTGGRLLAVGAYAAMRHVPAGGASYEDALPGEAKTYTALLPSPITFGAREIEMSPESKWATGDPHQTELYGAKHEAVVVTYHLGKGRVVWWAGAWPMTNLGISSKQNLELFLNAVGPPGGTRVLWDEYFHGERGSLWAYLRTTPVPWVGAQLLLFGAAVVATFGRRWGPLRPRRTESRLSPLEFVETLGGLYQGAHAAGPAVGVALQRFRFLLTRRLGLPANYSAVELGRAARARLGPAADGLADALGRAEAAAEAAGLSDAKALELVQALDNYAEALRLTPRAPVTGISWTGATKGAS